MSDRNYLAVCSWAKTLCRSVFIAVLVLTLADPQSASAAATDVFCGPDKLGTIDFANYAARYAYFDPNANGGNGGYVNHPAPRQNIPLQNVDVLGGANFEATFNFTGCPAGETLRPGEQFRWLQVVTTNKPGSDPTRGAAPTTGYIDPWGPTDGTTGVGGSGYEDLKPFYWTDAELANANLGGNPNFANPPTNLKFSDTSRRAFTDANAAAVNWQAQLSLVCTWDQKIKVLGYYTWGWTMPMGMATDGTKTISLNPANPTFTAGAPAGLNGILTAASEFGPGYAGDPNRAGWTLTTEPCCIPEPMTGCVFLLVFGACLTRRSRRAAA